VNKCDHDLYKEAAARIAVVYENCGCVSCAPRAVRFRTWEIAKLLNGDYHYINILNNMAANLKIIAEDSPS
jgi:hypothetical protein